MRKIKQNIKKHEYVVFRLWTFFWFLGSPAVGGQSTHQLICPLLFENFSFVHKANTFFFKIRPFYLPEK